jgi:hypothetical protein
MDKFAKKIVSIGTSDRSSPDASDYKLVHIVATDMHPEPSSIVHDDPFNIDFNSGMYIDACN